MKNWREVLIGKVEGGERGLLAGLLRVALTALSLAYCLLIQSVLFLYRLRILRKRKLAGLVISVGNITVGGTGKTPLVEMLASGLERKGCRVAILSRGYGRTVNPASGKRAPRSVNRIGIVSNGKKLLMDVREAGDEPYLLAKNLPGVAVLVGKDRRLTGDYALRKFGVDTIILDDGYQYWPLKKDLELVVIDSTNPFGTGHLLPRGRLREPLGSLKRADLFLLTRVDQADQVEGLMERLGKINPQTRILESVHHPSHLIDLRTGERTELTIVNDKRVLSLSSIGNPESFEKTLTGLGALLVARVRFPDHHLYQPGELKGVEEEAIGKGAELIITTEKDAVRLHQDYLWSLPILFLKVQLKIVRGRETWERQVLSLAG